MPSYTYRARNTNGEIVNGILEAESEDAIASNLDKLGYAIIEIAPKAPATATISNLTGRYLHRVKKGDVILFTRQLSTLLRSGMGLLPALTTAIEQSNHRNLKPILENIHRAVQSGKSFSEALSQYPGLFNDLFINMVRVGETAGMLDKVLDRLSTLGVQEVEISSRIKSALLYPLVLVSVAFLVVNFLVIGVLPKFALVFTTSQMDLPLATQLVLGLSSTLRRYWWLIFFLIIVIAIWFRAYMNTEGGKFSFHSFLLKFPIFGTLYAKIQISRFARILSVLTTAGVPLLESLSAVEKTITNEVIRKAIQNIRISLTEGKSLAEQFKISGLFPPMVIQMISTGEKTGELDKILGEVADFYEPEIEYTIKNLTSVLEPVMLLIMGIIVAFIALSVLLPIFNLIKVFRN
ncbi:MAG: type II secretion system F family protein [Candidatus Omnitrophica bacterium]|nr:type II secretion system F family protein [Candidatus Omnitrophota bacterium]